VNFALLLALVGAMQFLFAVIWNLTSLNAERALRIDGCFWIVFGTYWAVSALGQKAAKKRENLLERLRHIIPMAVACALLSWSDVGYGRLGQRFAPETEALNLLGLVLAGAGLAFAIWARWHLGANWSAIVSIREEHELIRTGPYRAVRHPIYTGMLLAVTGTVLIVGEFRALIAFAIVLASFYLKARKEEYWLAHEFGERFEAHAKGTGMFLPRFS
jgi:protein-S-isoprenylcysteine O-methyltransferase Ste14